MASVRGSEREKNIIHATMTLMGSADLKSLNVAIRQQKTLIESGNAGRNEFILWADAIIKKAIMASTSSDFELASQAYEQVVLAIITTRKLYDTDYSAGFLIFFNKNRLDLRIQFSNLYNKILDDHFKAEDKAAQTRQHSDLQEAKNQKGRAILAYKTLLRGINNACCEFLNSNSYSECEEYIQLLIQIIVQQRPYEEINEGDLNLLSECEKTLLKLRGIKFKIISDKSEIEREKKHGSAVFGIKGSTNSSLLQDILPESCFERLLLLNFQPYFENKTASIEELYLWGKLADEQFHLLPDVIDLRALHLVVINIRLVISMITKLSSEEINQYPWLADTLNLMKLNLYSSYRKCEQVYRSVDAEYKAMEREPKKIGDLDALKSKFTDTHLRCLNILLPCRNDVVLEDVDAVSESNYLNLLIMSILKNDLYKKIVPQCLIARAVAVSEQILEANKKKHTEAVALSQAMINDEKKGESVSAIQVLDKTLAVLQSKIANREGTRVEFETWVRTLLKKFYYVKLTGNGDLIDSCVN